MLRIVRLLRVGLALLMLSGAGLMSGASLAYGREATVWSLANLFPGSARLAAASFVNTLTAPVGWMERGLGWRFGKVGSLAEAQSCMEKRGDRPQADRRCIRDAEAYIPIPGITYRSTMFWNDGKPCTIQLERAEFDRYIPTQLGVHLSVEASGRFMFAAANGAVLKENALHTYELDKAGCEFVKDNEDAYEWGIVLMKGFRNDLDMAPTPKSPLG